MRMDDSPSLLTEENPRCYVLVGFEDTWKASLRYNAWGFSERSKGFWNTSSIGDYLAFYVGKPVQKIIGFGRITDKMIEDTIVWPDEEFFKKPFYRYRLKFKKLSTIDDWEKGIEISNDIILRSGRATITRDKFLFFVRQAEHKWDREIDVDDLRLNNRR